MSVLVMHQVASHGKGYESSDDEHGVEDVVLEGEQGQAHVGEDEVLRQEVQQFKELQHNRGLQPSRFIKYRGKIIFTKRFWLDLIIFIAQLHFSLCKLNLFST